MAEAEGGCPHYTITQVVEDGEPKETWTCDACGERFVTVDTMIGLIRGIAAALFGSF